MAHHAPSAHRLVDLLTYAQRRMARGVEDVLAHVDLTLDQWRTLRAIDAYPGLTMGELSEWLLTPPPTTTRLVDTLVDRALVYRRASSTDRRRVESALTVAGERVLDRAEALVDAQEAVVRKTFDPGAVDEMIRSLRNQLER